MCGAGWRSMLHRICVSTPQESTSEKPHKNLCFTRSLSFSRSLWVFFSHSRRSPPDTIPVEKCTKRSNLKFCFPTSTTTLPPCHSNQTTTTHINMLRFSFLVTSVGLSVQEEPSISTDRTLLPKTTTMILSRHPPRLNSTLIAAILHCSKLRTRSRTLSRGGKSSVGRIYQRSRFSEPHTSHRPNLHDLLQFGKAQIPCAMPPGIWRPQDRRSRDDL